MAACKDIEEAQGSANLAIEHISDAEYPLAVAECDNVIKILDRAKEKIGCPIGTESHSQTLLGRMFR